MRRAFAGLLVRLGQGFGLVWLWAEVVNPVPKVLAAASKALNLHRRDGTPHRQVGTNFLALLSKYPIDLDPAESAPPRCC